MKCVLSDILWFIFCMVLIRGSCLEARVGGQDRLELIEDWIQELISDEVVTIVWGSIPNLFRSINTAMIELFDDRYAALYESVVVAATMPVVANGVHGERAVQYRDFDNTKPLVFDGVPDPIIAIRWLSDLDVCFFTCS